jgi:ABC-2 type transport system permease protein
MLAGMLEGLITQSLFSTVGTQLLNPQNVSATVDKWMTGIAKADDLTPKQKDDYSAILRDWKQILPTESIMAAGGGMSLNNIVLIKKTDMSSTEAGPRTSFEITFPQSVFWALIGCCGAFAVSLVVERTRGTLLRLRLAPISRTQLLAGKGLACFVASIVVATGLMMFGAIVFKIRVLNLPLLILALAAASSCFVGLMMSISVLGRTEQAVGGAAWAILLVFSMIGGGMLPLAFMPSWLQTLSNISPVKWGILAVEGAVWRGFTVSEMLVPVGVLFGLGILFFSIGAWVLSKREL